MQRIGPALLACVVLAGCRPAHRDPDPEALSRAAETYCRALRWNRAETAAAALPRAQRTAFLDAYEALGGDLRVLEFRVRRIEGMPALDEQDHDDATVIVEWSVYRLPATRVQRIRQVQTWSWDGERWFLVHRAPPLIGTNGANEAAPARP